MLDKSSDDVERRKVPFAGQEIDRGGKYHAPNVIWSPQPGSQTLFLSCPVFEALYHGTRGPGKTEALLMDFARDVGRGFGTAWRGLLLAREYKDLDDVVTKSKRWFPAIFPGARFLESHAHYKWRFPEREELLFRVVKRADDYWKYHGHEYPWIGWEELTKWADGGPYEDFLTLCRSSRPGLPRRYRATTNPYGVGHNWVKARFIDPAPSGTVIGGEGGRERVAIFGSITENKMLLASDPGYLQTLQSIGDANKRKAWLDGDWDVVAGGMFDDVWDKSVHVLTPFAVPRSWRVDRSFDWGSAKPFSVGWWAESDGSDVVLPDSRRRSFPRGTLVRIAEWYGWNGRANEGGRLVDSEIARGILRREQELGIAERVKPGPADSSIYDETNADSPAEIQARCGVRWLAADKSPGSRARGWEAIRRRLKAAMAAPMEEPGLFVFDTCRHFIRTVPVLARSAHDPDDIDTDAEDHVADETRYRVLAARSGRVRVRKLAGT
ncbi:MAG: terminase [Pseudomonadota bacterium]